MPVPEFMCMHISFKRLNFIYSKWILILRTEREQSSGEPFELSHKKGTKNRKKKKKKKKRDFKSPFWHNFWSSLINFVFNK